MAVQKILVAVDRSSLAPVVFEQALELADKGGSSLMVFHTLNWNPDQDTNPLLGIGTLADVDTYGTLERLRHESLCKDIEQVKTWLKAYAEQATAKNIRTEIDCKLGNPSSMICQAAQSWGADLIVLGRRGYNGLSEILLGSVSNYVIHHAPCSVLVVQGIQSA